MIDRLGMCTMCTRRGGWNGTWSGRRITPFAFVALALALLCSLTAPCAAQPGFLSIDCGSETEYTDAVSGIKWVTDRGYISTGLNTNQLRSKTSTVNNATQLWDARLFPERRKRNCYLLPVEAHRLYLIRSTYLYSSLSNNNNYPPVSFDVYVNSTFWATVTYGGNPGYPGRAFLPTDRQVFEMIFRSTGQELSVCLVGQTGTPFISSLALRRLDDGMYRRVTDFRVLLVFYRFNFGVEPLGGNMSISYPEDQYDRLWDNFGPSSDTERPACPYTIKNSTAVASTPQNSSDNNQPPVAVMQTACVSYDGTIEFHLDFPSTLQEYYAVLYLQEIDVSVTAANPRGMSVVAKDIKTLDVNVTSNVTQISTPPENLSGISFDVEVTRLNWSTQPPIVNAAEFCGEGDLNNAATDTSDLVAINTLRDGLNLTSWTGDPCFPVSWDWVTCDHSSPAARVIGVGITGMETSGFISPSISRLTQLTDLRLGSNHLTGTIPDLRNLTMLRSLDLQNNNLSGEFPGYLFNTMHLSELYVQRNSLTGDVPDCPRDSSLKYECEGNPQLRGCHAGIQDCSRNSGGYSGQTVWIIVGSSLGGVAILTFITGLAFCLVRRRRRKSVGTPTPRPGKVAIKPQNSNLVAGEKMEWATAFTYDQLVQATDNFARKIGEGSFGAVYHGQLSGKEVAVKTNAGSSREGRSEFLNEVNLLSRAHHKNLVSLLGYSDETKELILVYDYMANGTLRQHLYHLPEGASPLPWSTRLSIAISSAKGLEYLHTACNPRIIHRDVKSSNILLDDQMVAKVADFGLSKSGREFGFTSGFSTVLKGTPGYFDPEYFVTQRLTQKSDVYSFGMVLLEIVSGRPPYPSEVPDGNIRTLSEWMQATIDTDIFAIVDPALQGTYNEDSMRVVIELAATCLEQRGIRRPDSTQVVQRLAFARDLEPSASSRNRTSVDSGLSSPFGPSASAASFPSVRFASNFHSNIPSTAYMSTDLSYQEGR